MGTPNFIQRLEALEGDQWVREPPAPSEEIDTAEEALGCTFPSDYRELLRRSRSGVVYGPNTSLVYEPVNRLVELNQGWRFTDDLSDPLVFGSDEGGCLYFFDPQDHLGNGPDAVYYVEMNVFDRDSSVLIGESLSDVVSRVLDGANFLDYFYSTEG
ncbi:SMI1-KNR4 cell-wall [Halogranum amylolyticum]|uniref:SMI1-KNR4 cell-wall n=2 Tax=Halogranum amylolyticum TaxID=660520 RepID=A0A1H8WG26_9EURY|nr:SMI1-KNR4 cell-wall [Halogranum amylolyticum]